MSGRESEWSCVPLGYATGVWRCVVVCVTRDNDERARERLFVLVPSLRYTSQASSPSTATYYTSQASSPAIKLVHQQQPITHLKQALHLPSCYIINNLLHISSKLSIYYTSQALKQLINNLSHIASQLFTYQAATSTTTTYYTSQAFHLSRYYIINNPLHIPSCPSYSSSFCDLPH